MKHFFLTLMTIALAVACSENKQPQPFSVIPMPNDVTIHFGVNPNLGAEEYVLKVKKEGVNLEASAFNGFFYGIETLKQMLPEEIYRQGPPRPPEVLPS